MKAKLLKDMECQKCPEFPNGIKPMGTVIDHPDAFRLVQLGCAEPADGECKQRANMTPEKLQDAIEWQENAAVGALIDDEDEDEDDE